MRNFGLHFILILSALVVAGVVVADAVAYTWDDAEWLFLEKINDARANPLAAAEALGVDVQELAVSQPLFHAAIKDGIPILETDDRLSAAATGHAQEMVDFDFLSKRSLNGETYQDRLTLVGYPAGSTGESLGLLIFQNFIGVEDAINLLVAQILRKEYSFEGRFDRNILDPEFTRVGIGLKAGTTNVNGTDRNAYFLTCDFALDRTTDQGSKAEEEELILSLINQARRRPLATAEALGIDLATLAVNRPHFFDEWVQGAEALGPDDVLKWQALLAVSLHLEGLVPSGQAFSADGGGDWTVKKPYRILEKPDLSLVVGHRVIYDETLGSDNATAMCALVNRIVMDEMILWERTTPGILSRQVNEAGIILSRRGVTTNTGELAVVEAAAIVLRYNTVPSPMATIHYFNDLDQNGLFSPGEELSYKRVRLLWNPSPVGYFGQGELTTNWFGVAVAPVNYGINQLVAEEAPDVSAIFKTDLTNSLWVPIMGYAETESVVQ